MLVRYYHYGNIRGMKFRKFFNSMNNDEKDAFAKRAGTTQDYIYIHLMSDPPRKIPRRPLMEKLIEAGEGTFSFDDLIKHFYPEKKTVNA